MSIAALARWRERQISRQLCSTVVENRNSKALRGSCGLLGTNSRSSDPKSAKLLSLLLALWLARLLLGSAFFPVIGCV